MLRQLDPSAAPTTLSESGHPLTLRVGDGRDLPPRLLAGMDVGFGGGGRVVVTVANTQTTPPRHWCLPHPTDTRFREGSLHVGSPRHTSHTPLLTRKDIFRPTHLRVRGSCLLNG